MMLEDYFAMAKFQGTMLNFQGVLLKITLGTLFLQVDVMFDLPALPVEICALSCTVEEIAF